MAGMARMARGTRVLGLACAAAALVYGLASALPVSAGPGATTLATRNPLDFVSADHGEVQPKPVSAKLDFSQITSRHMFREDRRPIVIAAPKDVVAEPKVARADPAIFEGRELVGIVEEDEVFRILLSSDAADETTFLNTGDKLGLWTFDHIEGSTAVFNAGDAEYRLELKERSPGVQAGALVRRQTNPGLRKRGRP